MKNKFFLNYYNGIQSGLFYEYYRKELNRDPYFISSGLNWPGLLTGKIRNSGKESTILFQYVSKAGSTHSHTEVQAHTECYRFAGRP